MIDRSGTLDKAEVDRLLRASKRHSHSLAALEPPFDLDKDWVPSALLEGCFSPALSKHLHSVGPL